MSKGVKGRGEETAFYADLSKILPWESAKGVWGAEKEKSSRE